MQKRKKKKVRVVLRRSHPFIWGCLLVAVALSVVALITLRAGIASSEAQYDDLRQQAAQLEENNEDLNNRIDGLGSIASAIQIAMEKLGLVFPDSIVFNPGN